MEKVLIERDKVLKALAGKMDDLYLAGGTSLSLYYFHHRESYDLDFFMGKFVRSKIENIISGIEKAINRKIILEKTQDQEGRAKVMIYHLRINKDELLKLDFVEDVYRLLKPLKMVDGIPVLSLEDIYIRKILAACGSFKTHDETGREVFLGGRQKARDFFDLYFLSKTFMPLSKFAFEHCSDIQREAIAVWYRAYSRNLMQMEVLEIATDKKVNFRDMDAHFKHEVSEMIKREAE